MMNRRDKCSAQQDAQQIGPKASQLLQEQESSSQTFTTVLLAAVVSLAVVVCVLFAQLRAGDYPPYSPSQAAAVASAKTRNRTADPRISQLLLRAGHGAPSVSSETLQALLKQDTAPAVASVQFPPPPPSPCLSDGALLFGIIVCRVCAAPVYSAACCKLQVTRDETEEHEDVSKSLVFVYSDPKFHFRDTMELCDPGSGRDKEMARRLPLPQLEHLYT